jgi:hypothetical protein
LVATLGTKSIANGYFIVRRAGAWLKIDNAPDHGTMAAVDAR